MKRSDRIPGDDNVARLLGQAYDPPTASAAFAARAARLQTVAAEEAQRRTTAHSPGLPSTGDWLPWPESRRCSGFVALSLHFIPRPAALALPHLALSERPMVAAPSPRETRVPLLLPGETLATRTGRAPPCRAARWLRAIGQSKHGPPLRRPASSHVESRRNLHRSGRACVVIVHRDNAAAQPSRGGHEVLRAPTPRARTWP